MNVPDQAAGLRQWSDTRSGAGSTRHDGVDAPDNARTLVVVGLPGVSPHHRQRVLDVLAHWSSQGQRWVGTVTQWRIAPVAIGDPHLPLLLTQQSRWALWVSDDQEAFRRAFNLLMQLNARQGPRRLLTVHPAEMPRRGLLDNLQQAAWHYLGIDLLVMAT